MRQDTDQDRTTRPSSNRVTVPEAAASLGVTVDAIRKRIQRGTIPHERHEDGRVYVLLDAARTMQDGDRDSDQDGYRTGDRTPPSQGSARDEELVEALREQIEFMRGELTTRNEELRRKDHIIAALTERIPELEAPAPPQEATDAHETASEAVRGVEDQSSGTVRPSEAQRRSWWRRLLGR